MNKTADTPDGGRRSPGPTAPRPSRARKTRAFAGVCLCAAAGLAIWAAPSLAATMLPGVFSDAPGGARIVAAAVLIAIFIGLPAAFFLGRHRQRAATAAFAARADDLSANLKRMNAELRRRDQERAFSPGAAFLTALGEEARQSVRAAANALGEASHAGLTPPLAAEAQRAAAAAAMMAELLDGVLAASAGETGGSAVVAFDPTAVVDAVAGAFGPAASARCVELLAAPSIDLPSRLLGQSTRIRQALAALIGEAILESRDDGGVYVAARWEAAGAKRGRLFVDVRRSGDGLTEPGAGFSLAEALATGFGGDILRSKTAAGEIVDSLSAPADVEREVGRLAFPGVAVLVAAPAGGRRAILLDRLAGLGVSAYAVDSAGRVLEAMGASDRLPDLVIACGRDRAALLALIEGLSVAEDRPSLAVLSDFSAEAFDRRIEAAQVYRLFEPVRQADLIAILRRVAGAAVDTGLAGPKLGLKTLLADADSADVEHSVGVLEALGCDVVVAATPAEAVGLASEDSFAAALIAFGRSLDEGLDAVRALRARESGGTERIRVIALGASLDATDRDLCRAAGVDAFLSKPLAMGAARAALARLSDKAAWEPDLTDPDAANALDALRWDNGEQLDRAIKVFLDCSPGLADRLESAVAAGDIDAAGELAGALRGVGREVGALELNAMMADVEALARAGDVGGMRSAAREIDRALADLNLALRTLQARG